MHTAPFPTPHTHTTHSHIHMMCLVKYKPGGEDPCLYVFYLDKESFGFSSFLQLSISLQQNQSNFLWTVSQMKK